MAVGEMQWDQDTERVYEGGVDKVALFVMGPNGYKPGVPWNGFTKLEEKPTGADIKKKYANNKIYAQLQSAEEYEATLEAFTCPREFYECNGKKEMARGVYANQQNRSKFGLVYRSLIGNDTQGYDYGYEYHIVYGCLAKPSNQTHETEDDDKDIDPLSWDISAEAPSTKLNGMKTPATITIDSRTVDAAELKAFENLVYGTDATTGETPTAGTEPTMPTIDRLLEIFTTPVING